MLDEIRRLFGASDYDFRAFACPDDPLRGLFEEWVPYYRLKWAIARALRPTRILEIGVRFGYSARAFLDGAPGAIYVGLDLDGDSWGGSKSAIRWAQAITREHKAAFAISDSQQLARLPGATWDLIHVDGQQDGDGFYADGRKALLQGRYVLLDGYLHSDLNFQAANELLRTHRELIEYWSVIPGYAGELFIRTCDSARLVFGRSTPAASRDIREAYTTRYFLSDCRGFDDWLRTGGKVLSDPRLVAIESLTALRRGGCVVDLGCGRGELTYAAAKRGAHVTAIDYSPEAIALTERCFEGEPVLRRQVEFVCGDMLAVDWPAYIDVAIASDVVERITPGEVERLYARVARHLAQDGLMIVHTFPNLWFCRYGYPRQRRTAQGAGRYLSPDPRSLYERLMHINEQSPRTLRDQLQRHFEHVLLWFGSPQDPVGSLAGHKPQSYFHAAPDLFAVASHSPIAMACVRACLTMQPIPPPKPPGFSVEVLDAPGDVPPGGRFLVTVRVTNRLQVPLSSLSPYPVHLAYHWVDESGGDVLLFDGLRTKLPRVLLPEESEEITMHVEAPRQTGSLRLIIAPVQEQVAWWDGAGIAAGIDVELRGHTG